MQSLTDRPCFSPTLQSTTTWELLALAADWVWEMDTQLRVVDVIALTGDPRPAWAADLIGLRPWDSPVFVRDRAAAVRQMRRLWRHVPFRDLELQWVSDAGEPRWTSISGIPRYAADGHFAGYVGVAVDISPRKRLERSLGDAQAERDATRCPT